MVARMAFLATYTTILLTLMSFVKHPQHELGDDIVCEPLGRKIVINSVRVGPFSLASVWVLWCLVEQVRLWLAQDNLLRCDIDDSQVLGERHRSLVRALDALEERIDGIVVEMVVVGYPESGLGDIKELAQAIGGRVGLDNGIRDGQRNVVLLRHGGTINEILVHE